MAHRCTYPHYEKHELCVGKGNSYPVTKNLKVDCGRVRNAIARASQNRKVAEIIKGGIKAYIKRCHIKSKLIK